MALIFPTALQRLAIPVSAKTIGDNCSTIRQPFCKTFAGRQGSLRGVSNWRCVQSIGGEAAYQKLIRNPVTGDQPGYEYFKPEGKPGDADYDHHQLILHQLNTGKRDPALESGYSDGSFE
jgi:hypothetical protein